MRGMTPSARLDAELAATGATADAAQRAALARLDALHAALAARPVAGLLERLGLRAPPPAPRGLYLWGGVGRGKTLLMDAFHHGLAEPRKLRLHFHRFMQEVHRELKSLKQERDPLELVAERLAARARVICFDEFHVADIADAMILGNLFAGLFARSTVLVATSNLPPVELYRDGLQRARFLPAIALIERHCEVLNVDGGVDYRLRALERAELYHTPLDAEADASLARSFRALAGHDGRADQALEIEGRPIAVRRLAAGVAWFDFAALCDGPRAAADYIELARLHHTVLVSGVPAFDPLHENQARRFIALVDELYDRGVKLVLSAAAPLAGLYRGERLGFEFERTKSRLLEMQSHEYLAREHRP
jgi:cell division protein ZapE